MHIFEDKFPTDKRPRNAIEAAKNYVKNPSEENRIAAREAEGAARAARAAGEAAGFESGALIGVALDMALRGDLVDAFILNRRDSKIPIHSRF